MTTAARDTGRSGYPSRHPAEVVAVLVDDGSAGPVALAAVEEAVERQVSVRFLQVVSPHVDDEGRAVAEESLFRTALHALRGHPRTHSVFEVVEGPLPGLVRRRSRQAALVVVGAEQGTHTSAGSSLAEQCRRVATCPVRTVRTG